MNDSGDQVSPLRQAWNKWYEFSCNILDWYKRQTRGKQVLIAFGLLIVAALAVFMALFHVYIIRFLVWLSNKWAEMKYGYALLFTLVFFVGFPPLLGFSSLSLLSGMTYGIAHGWILLAIASVTGSFASFLFYRYILREKSRQLLQSNEMFWLFAETIKHDQSLLLLILIRLCPLPYSLSNGALAAIPELSPLTYLLASVITTPKLFAHVFVGHQLKDLGNESNTTLRRVIDVVTMIITGMASALTTYIIYHKMQQRLNKVHADPEYNEMVFGDFGDDESGNNLELDSAEFDADNFIIEDEEDSKSANSSTPTSQTPLNLNNSTSSLTEEAQELDAPRGYRDY